MSLTGEIIAAGRGVSAGCDDIRLRATISAFHLRNDVAKVIV